jgi:hypothetical protein
MLAFHDVIPLLIKPILHVLDEQLFSVTMYQFVSHII